MFSRLSSCIFSILLILIFTSTSVYGVTCSYNQRQCYNYPYSWCCSDDWQCGSSPNSCNYYPPPTTTPSSSSDIPPAVIGVVIIISVSFFIICLVCCIRSHHQQQILRTSYVQTVTSPYQQQTAQGTIGVSHIRPVYNVGSARPYQQSPHTYEAPPPSYEAATASLSATHQSSSSVEHANLRV